MASLERTCGLMGLEWIVPDAMGVLYESGDDVTDVLIPYVRAAGSTLADEVIESAYLEASLGFITSAEFWVRCGVEGDDGQYITHHRLMDGVADVIAAARARGLGLACFSNDVAEWSLLLRRHFLLDDDFDAWCISGEIGARKPDPAAFLALTSMLGTTPEVCLFVDDRRKNVDTASALGFHTVLLGSAECRTLRDVVLRLER